jgi:hypothetical protein
MDCNCWLEKIKVRPSKRVLRKFEKAYRKGTISILWNQKHFN